MFAPVSLSLPFPSTFSILHTPTDHPFQLNSTASSSERGSIRQLDKNSARLPLGEAYAQWTAPGGLEMCP